MIQKGDKIRFMDEALEGTVMALVGKDRAEVLTTDGFTMIALLSQLVKVRSEEDETRMARNDVSSPPVEPLQEAVTVKRTKAKAKIFSFDETTLQEESVLAAFEVIDPDAPLTSPVQLHLINNSSQPIAFSLSRKLEIRDEGIAIDTMAPRSILSFFTYTQEELKLFESFRVQAIFHPSAKTAFRPPVQKLFKFGADELVESSDFIFGKSNCLLIPIADLKRAAEIDITPLVNKFIDKEEKSAAVKRQKTARSSKNIIYAHEKVVDLHIEELLKDTTSMTNSQIIAYQLKHFQYEMDQAILNRLFRITFIHGVGAGVLKSAIREELKKFSNIKFCDAPVEKYGYGATEIQFT